MNRRDDDARAAPVSDERPARFCDDAWPAPFFDRDPRRVATIVQQNVWSKMAANAASRLYRSKKTQGVDRCDR